MHSRRTFLELVAAAGGAAAIGGCDRASEQLATLLFGADAIAPRPPESSEIDELTHVLNRLTWGPRPHDRALVERMGVPGFIEQQLNPETISDRKARWRVAELETLQAPRAELYEFSPAQIMHDLSRAKLMRALDSERQLEELMVDFWSDHLNIAPSKGECRWMKLADDREVVRPHALGRFRDLIRTSATSPAMLVYLDGLDNKVIHPHDAPNENYARELLELHTLGVDGGYSQRDVMEAARCLSGWTFTHDWRRFFTARVAFDRVRHDHGAKELLGVAIPAGGGADDLERLIDIVCAHASTARHVATKLCRFFVAESPPMDLVTRVASAFSAHDGDTRATLRVLFAAPEFRGARGRLFKRPMRFVMSALRAVEARSDCGEPLHSHLRRMGHAPFEYPTPDGFPLESGPWLGSLLWRWNFALDLARNRIAGTSVDVPALLARFDSRDSLASHLLGRTPSAREREVLAEGGIDGLALALASPAFQWM